MKISDETLTAFLDGVLDEATAARVAGRIDSNAALKARLSRLTIDLPLMRKDYQDFAATMPLDALRAAIHSGPAPVAANSNAKGWSKAAIATACAACIALGMFMSPFAASYFAGFRGVSGDIASTNKKSWRQAVAEYQVLYAAETLAWNTQDPQMQDKTLAKLSARIGMPLDRTKLQLDKASYQRGQLLTFEGSPLIQLAYLYQGDTPVAFCLIADHAKDAAPASEAREGMPLIHWARGGVSYMVIGQLTADELNEIAQALSRQI
jgi:anti-sigma factor RsiW